MSNSKLDLLHQKVAQVAEAFCKEVGIKPRMLNILRTGAYAGGTGNLPEEYQHVATILSQKVVAELAGEDSPLYSPTLVKGSVQKALSSLHASQHKGDFDTLAASLEALCETAAKEMLQEQSQSKTPPSQGHVR